MILEKPKVQISPEVEALLQRVGECVLCYASVSTSEEALYASPKELETYQRRDAMRAIANYLEPRITWSNRRHISTGLYEVRAEVCALSKNALHQLVYDAYHLGVQEHDRSRH